MNILGFLISFGLLMIAMSVHEFSHALVAYKLGDTTAKFSGRLTLNPLAHIDLVGTLLLPFLLFMTTGVAIGAAKPVPINYWNLKNPKQDMIWIGAIGPVSNFLFAFLLSILWKFFPAGWFLSSLITDLIVINVMLGVFNLVPIPPLDGSRVLMGILPRELSQQYAGIEPFGFIIIMLLVWLGAFNSVVWPLVKLILKSLSIPF